MSSSVRVALAFARRAGVASSLLLNGPPRLIRRAPLPPPCVRTSLLTTTGAIRHVSSESTAEDKAAEKQLVELLIPNKLTVARLAELLEEKSEKVIEIMRAMKLPVGSEKTEIGFDMASSVALEFNRICLPQVDFGKDLIRRPVPKDKSGWQQRAPVVTIMGHVDHGKTTLLDSLRKTSVAAGEAGGITQHIGAFSVISPGGKQITFLDTPGHAAFSAMRARGAQVTDIVVLVVAADDGVMPQTIEALNHALAAEVPIIVAMNKCDIPLENSKEKKIKEELIEHGLNLEDVGGDVQVVKVSGLKAINLDLLEEAIIAQAEVMELKGDVTGPVEGSILEARVDKGKGNVATVLVQRGTLKAGSILVAGKTSCKVKYMMDSNGKQIKVAMPSMPVEVIGWKDIPVAGEEVLQAKDENEAEAVINVRKEITVLKERQKILEMQQEKKRVNDAAKQAIQPDQGDVKLRKGREIVVMRAKKYLHFLRARFAEQELEKDKEVDRKEIRYIVKADVVGSQEAIVGCMHSLSQPQVAVRVVSAGVGPVTLNDIRLASDSEAEILSFNNKVSKEVLAHAKDAGVKIHQQNIIYRLIEEIESRVCALMPPVVKEETTGEAVVMKLFTLNSKKKEVIAGCKVTFGSIQRSAKVQVVRDDEKIFEGSLDSLKHFKADVNEVTHGSECGLSLAEFKEVQEGDIIRVVKQTLAPVSVGSLSRHIFS